MWYGSGATLDFSSLGLEPFVKQCERRLELVKLTFIVSHYTGSDVLAEGLVDCPAR